MPIKRALQIGKAHPLVAAALAMLLVVALTLASQQIAFRIAPQAPQSEYDKHFTYEQIDMMWHFAMCDAMLFSTRPEDELENVKERIAIDVDYIAPTAPGSQGVYERRVRSRTEIEETIRLAEEFYERVNCK